MGDKHQAMSTREQTMSALQALILKAEGVFPEFATQPMSHNGCTRTIQRGALEIATPLVVLDNTCIRHWEYKPYENAALKAGYALVIVELRSIGTDHAELALALGSRNAHGVPIAKIEEMLGRWQEDPRACTVQIGGLAKAAESCTEMNPNSNMFMPSKGGQPNELQV